jgi:hypothetical protein
MAMHTCSVDATLFSPAPRRADWPKRSQRVRNATPSVGCDTFPQAGLRNIHSGCGKNTAMTHDAFAAFVASLKGQGGAGKRRRGPLGQERDPSRCTWMRLCVLHER